MVRKRLFLGMFSMGIALTFILCGCGGSKGNESASISSGEVVIKASEWKFEPGRISIRAGEPITLVLKNDGKTTHNVDFASLGIDLQAEPGQSKSITVTPNRTGEFEFACTLPGHRDSGMVGKLVSR